MTLGGAAHRAGLAAGDSLVALDGMRISPHGIDSLLERYHVGDRIVIHAFRRDELMTFAVKLLSAPVKLEKLVPDSRANLLRRSWTGYQ